MQPVSKEQFYEFVMHPENRDRNFEYVAGEIVEVVSNGHSSRKGAKLLVYVGYYIDTDHLGNYTGADGGYVVAGEDYIPDGAFISYARQPVPLDVAYNPVAPGLAIE